MLNETGGCLSFEEVREIPEDESHYGRCYNDVSSTWTIPLIYDFSETSGSVFGYKLAAFISHFRVNTLTLYRPLICKV